MGVDYNGASLGRAREPSNKISVSRVKIGLVCTCTCECTMYMYMCIYVCMNVCIYICVGVCAEHVLRKIHHCTFPRKISRRPFLGFYPKNLYIFFSLKNSDDLSFFF